MFKSRVAIFAPLLPNSIPNAVLVLWLQWNTLAITPSPLSHLYGANTQSLFSVFMASLVVVVRVGLGGGGGHSSTLHLPFQSYRWITVFWE